MLLLRSNNTHCFRPDSASKVLPRCFQGAFKVFPRYFQGASKVLPRCFQGAFKVLPRYFQGSFKVLPRWYGGDTTWSMLLLRPLASAQIAVVWNKVALAFFYSLSFQFYKQQTLSIQFGTTVQLKICIVHLVYREALRFPSWLCANITLLLKRLYINIAI